MNRKKLALGLLSIGAAGCVSALAADPLQLQFTNITAALYGSNYTATLNAVTFGGSSNFLAVGNQKKYILGNFVPGQPWFTTANWATNQITVGASNLILGGVASAGNLFVASGDNNLAFSAANAFSPGGLIWATNYNIFPNSSFVPGIAFNGTNFVAIGAIPEISSSGTNLPENKNWNAANFITPAPSFAESFRGITPFGARGFAACGVAGDVRLSSDGLNWSNAPIGSTTQPNYFSIADDGGNTVVCVGAATPASGSYGIIQVFTNINASVTPLAATNLPANNTPFNSVAYTGSGFVAVGNNGQLFTSTNGVTWFQIPPTNIPAVNVPSAASLNLYGVAFGAPGSLMQDIGEIVGTNGNVIVCAPPPPTNNSLGNKWISIGVTTPVAAGTNVTLPANTLQVTNAWGTNLVTVDWYDVPVGGSPLTSGLIFITNGMFSFTPPYVTNNADNVTNTYYAQARDLRTGFINTNRTAMVLTNFMRPTSAMVSSNIICNGDSTTLTNLLSGNGPWTVYWTDGFSNFTNTVGSSGVFYTAHPYTNILTIPNAAFDPTNEFQNAFTNHYYWVSKLTDAYFPADDPTNLNFTGTNWTGDLAGADLVRVNPRPTSASVTTNTICNGSPATLTNVLTGLGPWMVYWTDGFTNYTQVVSVPQAGPYTNTLVIPNGAFNPVDAFLNASTNHYYWVTMVTDSNCVSETGDITGTNLIMVNPRPTSTSLTTSVVCNGQAAVLTNVLTGFGPWTVYWTDGFTNYTQSVSVPQVGPYTNTLPLPNSNFDPNDAFANAFTNHYYWVVLVTDSNCSSDASDLAGTNLVTVYPRPTATVSGSTNICNGQSATVRAALTGTGPTWYVTWSETWPGGSNTLTIPYNTNLATLTVPTNALVLTNSLYNTSTNYTFTVVSLSDSSPPGCGAETNDLNGNAVVTVYPRPTATVSGTTNICNGQPAVIQAALTGTGPWTVTWGETWSNGFSTLPPVLYTTSVATLVVPTNLLTLTNLAANAPTNYTFAVVALSDASPSGCGSLTNDLYNSATVTVYPRPTATVSGSTNVCSGSSATIQAVLTGTGPTWNVTWYETWPGGSSSLMVTYNTNLATLTVPTNVLPLVNSAPNSTTNYTFTVGALSDSSPSSCAAEASDLRSNAVVKVYPLPTATVIQVTNSYYNLLTFDDLPETPGGILITNGYAGLDWVNFYELNGGERGVGFANGVVSTNNVSFNGFGNPASITNAVPFNLVSAYMTAAFTEGLQVTALGYTNGSLAYSNVYILSTNGPAFIVFNYTNVNEVDFSATNTDWFVIDNLTIKQTGPTAEICNGDVAGLQAVLTGIGPWTVQWTDGISNYTQVVNTNVAGPYTNTLMIPNTAFNPTNVLLNQTTNYAYSIVGITSGTNASPCSGSILGGPAMVTVSPRPTAFVTGYTNITVTNNSPVVVMVQADLTGFGPWQVKWSDGTNQIYTNSPAIRYTTNSLNIITNYPSTNYIYEEYTNLGSDTGASAGQVDGIYITNTTLTGVWIQNSTIANYQYHAFQWELYSKNKNIGTKKNPNWANYFTVQTNPVPGTASALSVTNLYSVMNLTDATCVASVGDLTGSATVVLSSYPSANIAVDATNICLGNPVVITATFSGTPPWTNYWSDGTTNVVYTTFTNRIVVPTATGWYTNTITNFVDGSGVTSTNITGSAAVYVNPVPAGVPVSDGDVTNCAGQPNPPLTVTDANLVSWYDSGMNLVAWNTNSFIPPDSVAGTTTYYAAETNSSGCVGSLVPVNLILVSCTNPPTISLSGTNGTIQWFGNLVLQSTTNLTPPVVWQNISTGMVSTNVLSFTNGVPPWTNPMYFFRLTN